MKLLVFLIFIVLALSSCSVVMSGKTSGTDMKDFTKSTTRSGIVAHDGVTITATETNEQGVIVCEDYLVQKKKGSIMRAVMHGVLDVATLGLWEVIGTPVEMSQGGKTYIPVRVCYNDMQEVEKIEFLQQ